MKKITLLFLLILLNFSLQQPTDLPLLHPQPRSPHLYKCCNQINMCVDCPLSNACCNSTLRTPSCCPSNNCCENECCPSSQFCCRSNQTIYPTQTCCPIGSKCCLVTENVKWAPTKLYASCCPSNTICCGLRCCDTECVDGLCKRMYIL